MAAGRVGLAHYDDERESEGEEEEDDGEQKEVVDDRVSLTLHSPATDSFNHPLSLHAGIQVRVLCLWLLLGAYTPFLCVCIYPCVRV